MNDLHGSFESEFTLVFKISTNFLLFLLFAQNRGITIKINT